MATVVASAIPVIQGNGHRNKTPSTLQSREPEGMECASLELKDGDQRQDRPCWSCCFSAFAPEGCHGQARRSLPTGSIPFSRASAADHRRQRFSAEAVLPDCFGRIKRPLWTSPFRMNGGQAVTIALPLIAGTAGLIAADKDAAQVVA